MMKNVLEYVALSSRVLAVASVNYYEGELHKGKVFDWAAYIDAVPGENHDHEFKMVAMRGTKLPVNVAHVLFPDYPVDKWRD